MWMAAQKEAVDSERPVLAPLSHPCPSPEPADEEQVEVCQSFLSAKAKAPLEPQPEAVEEMAAA